MTAEHSEADWLSRAGPADLAGRQDGVARPAIGVLADRLAAALVHHEPGWRLPRHTALARRYNVSPAEIETAVGELVSRHLVRRLADGQLYRASPAEYLIEIEGVSGLASSLDPMGGDIACRSRQVSWRRVPEDIGWALGLETVPPQGATPRTPQQETSDAVCVVRFLWTADGEPAACTTTYLPADRVTPGAYEPGAAAAGRADPAAAVDPAPRLRPGGGARCGRGPGQAGPAPCTSRCSRRRRPWPAACGCPRASRPRSSRSGSTTRPTARPPR